jgi:hypothetical protein
LSFVYYQLLLEGGWPQGGPKNGPKLKHLKYQPQKLDTTQFADLVKKGGPKVAPKVKMASNIDNIYISKGGGPKLLMKYRFIRIFCVCES